MQALDIIHFSANQRAAIAALEDCGISPRDITDEAGYCGNEASANDERASGAAAGEEDLTSQVVQAPRRRAHSAWSSLQIAVVFLDLIILSATPMVCHWLYFGNWVVTEAELAFVTVSWIITLCSLQFSGAYTRTAMQRPALVMKNIMLAEAGAIIVVLGFGFITRGFDNLSRLWVVISWVMSVALLMIHHVGITALVIRIMKAGYLRERVAIVCTGPIARLVLEKFQEAASPEVLIVGIFDDRKARLPTDFEGYQVKGDTDNLLSHIRRNGIDRVIVTIPWSAEERIVELVAKLRQAPVRVDLIPNKLIWEFPSDVRRIHGVPILTVANHRVDAQMDWLKRVEDLILGLLLLLLFAPVMIAVAIAIRLDSPGPILFRQKRAGYNNEVVEVFKFRSMYADRPADPDVQQAKKQDPRVTRVGRFIRKTSLDELPQLLHVVTGRMSLVGPRPHAIPHNDYFGNLVDGYFARHNVKPGITGWAQVNGCRGETDTVEKMNSRVRYDLEYIERWSLLLDLKIIFLTALRVWFQESAY
jgi:Undecaprenyl-phosphate glucose phosphotransferase